MGFLDNLESSLKNLESRDEKESQRDRERREEDSAAVRAAAPYAEQLKDAQFTQDLLTHATRLGYAKRMKVHIVWLGATLRLDAREKRLELRPTPGGIVSVFIENGNESRTATVNLDGSAEALAQDWLG
jgi:hypothetical protein